MIHLEMKAMLTYMQWLSQGVPVGAKIEGQGLKKIDFILRAADPKKGKAIYMDNVPFVIKKMD
ncbi:hypothetical protein H8C94_001726 [Campylobacter jejuni]|nr:hypothetical protein [Campylobacter jejuni]